MIELLTSILVGREVIQEIIGLDTEAELTAGAVVVFAGALASVLAAKYGVPRDDVLRVILLK